MRCFIKDASTFKTKCMHGVSSYDLTLNSIYDETSEISLPGCKLAQEGDFAIIDGKYIFIISEIERNDDLTTLKCKDVMNLFSRDLVYSTAPTSLETYVKSAIEDNFKNQSDALYKLPFLSVTAETATAGTLKPDIDDGVWNIKSYCAKLRRLHGIYTYLSVSGDTLNIKIKKETRTAKNIDFSLSAYRLLDEAYSSENVGKITVICTENSTVTNYFLMSDGSVSTSYSSTGRINGKWTTMTVENAADVLDKVKDEFAKNSSSHMIEFDSDKTFLFYQPVRIKNKDKIFSSYISAVRYKDGATTYKTGELRLEFTMKGKKVI